jgi:Flp pilus assembly protein TadG
MNHLVPAMSSPRSVRGLAAVELALLTPMFLFMMMMVVEVGRLLAQYNTLTKAVRDSAEYLAHHAVTPAMVFAATSAEETVAKNLVVYGGPVTSSSKLLPGIADTNVSLQYTPAAMPQYVTVTVVYNFQALGLSNFGFVGITLPGTVTASVRMRGVGGAT